MTPSGHADHVVHLHLSARAHAKPALDARIQVNAHRDVAVIQQRNATLFQLRKPAFGHAIRRCHIPEMGGAVVALVPLWLIRQQHFDNHLARRLRARRIGRHNHPFGGFTDAGRDQCAFTFNFNHARTAVAIRTISRCRFVTQMRDHKTASICDLPDRHACICFDVLPVERKAHLVRHRMETPSSRPLYIAQKRTTGVPFPTSAPGFPPSKPPQVSDRKHNAPHSLAK